MLNADLIYYSFYIFFTITILTKAILLFLNMKNIKSHFNQVPAQFQDHISLEDHKKAQNYTLSKNKLNLTSLLLQAIFLILWIEAGWLDLLHQSLTTQFESTIMTGVMFLISFSIINSLLSLPESIYGTFVLEEKYGFNKTTPKIFLVDMIKQFALSLIIGAPFLYFILKILYTVGPLWWLYTWFFIMAFQFIMIWAYPKFIAPLFNKFSKLDDEDLTQEIDKLSKRCDINFKDYFVMNASLRSSHGNAYFTGFGKNKRIVFFDTLLKSLNVDEVVSVLAHELGHLKKKHIIKSIIMSSAFLFIGLFILGQLYNSPKLFEAFSLSTNEAYMALLLFVLIAPYYTFLLTPLMSWLSRKNEFEADEFAATHASAKKLITALLKMYKDNSSSLTPHPTYSKFYYSHPPAKERIDFLKKFST
ncbi:MAG: M48 family metallopeptidase [Bacteriovoracaceae bacterium]|nr:M48 family metallopeptidase [Bacteriovoracaceae bacterium]